MTRSDVSIGYLGRVLPSLSETFVVREIEELRALGIPVKPFSILKPAPDSIHPEMKQIADQVIVLSRPANPMFWLSHLIVLISHPLKYFRSFWRTVVRAGRGHRFQNLKMFTIAPYTALNLHRAGVRHLHAHFANSPAGVARIAADLAGISFSFTAHAYDILIDNFQLAEKLKTAAFVATISSFNISLLRKNYAEAAAAEIVLVRCGVDPDSFPPRPQPFAEKKIILAVGRLVETKGFKTLVKACSRLKTSGWNFKCFIVGEGPERAVLEKMITEFALEDTVKLTGKMLQDELKKLYREANLLALPACERGGDHDGIPVVLMEAMSMEIPVVTTRISGIPELVRDGETGLLTEPDDPESLADAIGSLFSDPDMAGTLARSGRKWVAEEFNIHKSAVKLHSLFTDLLGKSQKPA